MGCHGIGLFLVGTRWYKGELRSDRVCEGLGTRIDDVPVNRLVALRAEQQTLPVETGEEVGQTVDCQRTVQAGGQRWPHISALVCRTGIEILVQLVKSPGLNAGTNF